MREGTHSDHPGAHGHPSGGRVPRGRRLLLLLPPLLLLLLVFKEEAKERVREAEVSLRRCEAEQETPDHKRDGGEQHRARHG